MKKIASFALFILFASNVNAGLLNEGKALCAKIKSCATVEVDKQNLSAEERQAVLGIFDTQCIASVQKYETDLDSAGLEKKAHACLKSLTEKDCATLVGGTGPVTTPVCTDFENAAKAAGISLGE